MGRSIARLPEPGAPPSTGDRRRRIRQKLHTPVYVSFNGPTTGMVVDLSELLDLSEDGFAVQTAVQYSAVSDSTGSSGSDENPPKSDRLEVNHHVTLCLDLPETKSFVHGNGQVIWCDRTGRAGIRFAPLAPDAARVLKEWLFVNLLVGSANHSARADQLARHRQQASVAGSAAPILSPEPLAAAISSRAEQLSALDELRNQIRGLTTGQTQGAQVDTILQLITEHAMTLTRASGAALALSGGGEMVCRARIGDPAPLLGSIVDVSHGISGECIRTGRPILCQDTSSDRRVDPELCRALHLGSFLAAPVISNFHVVGLLEVFSPVPRKFSSDETTILQRLAELVPGTQVKSAVVPISGPPSDVSASAGSAGASSSAATPAAPASEEARADAIDNNALDAAEPPPDEPKTDVRGSSASAQDSNQTAVPTEIEPSGSSSTQASAPAALASGSAELDPAQKPASDEITPLEHLRAALWHHASDLEMQAQSAVADQSEVHSPASPSEDISEDDVEDDFKNQEPDANPSASAATTSLGQLGLLLCTLAVVALALGYLLAPVIERHLTKADNDRPPATVQAANFTRLPTSPEDLRKLADQGNSEAQFTLGTLYRNGDGVLQNDQQAVEWFQRAADQGHVQALRALGSAYWGGRGVQQNYLRAYFWYELALAGGDQESKSRLEGLATQMTQTQVATARQQAEAWLQAHNPPARSASN